LAFIFHPSAQYQRKRSQENNRIAMYFARGD
jgi:hypothetical protein